MGTFTHTHISIFSYIYIAAMLGLGALGDIFPEDIIPLLGESFNDSLLAEDTRLKLGETLLRVCERCGEVFPKYGTDIHSHHSLIVQHLVSRQSCYSATALTF